MRVILRLGGRKHHYDVSSFGSGFFVHYRLSAQAAEEVFHYLYALIGTGIFPAFHSYGNFNFVACFQEFEALFCFDGNIANVYGHGKPYFFELYNGLVFAVFLILFGLLVFEFGIIHYFAYGRNCRGRNLNEVELLLVCEPLSLRGGHYAEHLSIGRDYPYFPVADIFVDRISVFNKSFTSSFYLNRIKKADCKSNPP